MDEGIPEYARVTEILSIFQGFSSVPRERLKKAQDMGTAVHNYIEEYFNSTFSLIPVRYSPYMESFYRWVHAWGPHPIQIEKRLYCEELMITGKPDLICHFGCPERPYIIDFKTSKMESRHVWNLQLHFYHYLLKKGENAGNKKYPMMVVQLSPEGKDPIIHEFSFKKEYWEICLFSIDCWKYFVKNPLEE